MPGLRFRERGGLSRWLVWARRPRSLVVSLLILIAPTLGGGKPNVARPPVVSALVATPDGRGFLVGSQAGIAFHATNNADPEPFPTDLDHVHALAFTPDRSMLAVAGGSPAESGIVELRRWPKGELLEPLEGHEDVVNDVVWIDNETLATAGADRVVKAWNVLKRAEIAGLTGHSGPVRALAVSPDQEFLCSASVDGTIRVWDLDSWTLLRTLTNHLGPVHSLAFQPADPESPLAVLASASEDRTVRIWQPAIGRMVRIIRHPAPVVRIGWDKEGRGAVSASKDGVVRWIAGDRAEILKEEILTEEHWLTCLVWLAAAEAWVVGETSGRISIVPDLRQP